MSVTGLTHQHGHFHLLSYGFHVYNIEMMYMYIYLQSGRTTFKFLITSLAIRCLIIRKWSNEYFSAITEKIHLNPRVLFSTLNSVVNPPVSDCHDVSLQTCEHFLKHFIEKIATEED